jgi:hypothetical protein
MDHQAYHATFAGHAHPMDIRCVLVHDRTTSTLILAHKEDLLQEVENQLAIDPDRLDEQDRLLLECNFDELASTTGKQQEYWLLAIQAAREVSRIRRAETNVEQRGNGPKMGI